MVNGQTYQSHMKHLEMYAVMIREQQTRNGKGFEGRLHFALLRCICLKQIVWVHSSNSESMWKQYLSVIWNSSCIKKLNTNPRIKHKRSSRTRKDMLVMLVADLLEGTIHILKHVSVLLTWNLLKSSMLELQNRNFPIWVPGIYLHKYQKVD